MVEQPNQKNNNASIENSTSKVIIGYPIRHLTQNRIVAIIKNRMPKNRFWLGFPMMISGVLFFTPIAIFIGLWIGVSVQDDLGILILLNAVPLIIGLIFFLNLDIRFHNFIVKNYVLQKNLLKQKREMLPFRKDIDRFDNDEKRKFRRSFGRMLYSTVLSLLLYLMVILAISLITITFIVSLGTSDYTKNLSELILLLFLIYAFFILYGVSKVFKRGVVNDLYGIEGESQAKQVLESQRKQILYILPLALAWLAFIGLKM